MKRSATAECFRTSREVNDEMILYWAERILLECMKVDKPLSKVKICIKGITFRAGVKEFYHSRNLALAKHLVRKRVWMFTSRIHSFQKKR